jgi:excisionase family DNA binding protein
MAGELAQDEDLREAVSRLPAGPAVPAIEPRIRLAGAPHGAPVVRSFRPLPSPTEPLLTVREVAARLSVCTATVYALCERVELPHLRVSNAIRVVPSDLAAFIAMRGATGRGS